jgi:hypothetical protein
MWRPASGLSLAVTAARRNRSSSALQAWMTAEETLAVEFEPPETGAGGSAVSPISTSTAPRSRPRRSAETWAATVRMPVPISCEALCTVTRPSANSRTRAVAAHTLVG